VTFVSIAAEHPLATHAAAGNDDLAAFIAELRKGGVSEAELETQEKRGMDTGLRARHPVTGEALPIWVANFVLMNYGTGAVMAVPGHDERDFEFAHKYGLPVKQVIAWRTPLPPHLQGDMAYDAGTWKDWYADKTRGDLMCVNSGPLDGLAYKDAFDRIATILAEDHRAERRVNFRLRDWGVSRQRYWGCPIPVVHCATCGAVPVPDDQLPVVLPEDVADAFRARTVQSPIKADPEWRKTTCPQCGGPAERETDTFDTFMESSWYYARYTSPGAPDMVDERANYWLPVDQYIGGIEHAILHLLYFRFYHKLLRDAGMVKSDEPAEHLLCQGMVIADTFYREDGQGHREWFNPADVDVAHDERGRISGAKLRADGQPVHFGGTEKMAKSKNNGIDPQAMVDRYGADTVRLFAMFTAPPEQSLDWSEEGVAGMQRFLKRLWTQVHKLVDGGPAPMLDAAALSPDAKALRRQLHEVIQKVGDDYGRRYTFNTAIAAVMELLNALAKFNEPGDTARALRHEAFEAIALLLNPITPHTSHALWQLLGHSETTLEDVAFPKADPAALVRDSVTLAVQVNGKLRATLDVAVDAAREDIERLARAEPQVAKYLDGHAVKKVIVVPGKIVNIVAVPA
jgi:leucyl-tRNA synthetase